MITIDLPEWVMSFGLHSRREDIPKIPRFEAHVSHKYFKDQFGRGCGDVWGHGYSYESLDHAFELALANCLEAARVRLEDCNARASYKVPVLREDPAKPINPLFKDLELDL